MRPPAPVLLAVLAACGSTERIETVTVAAPGATDVFCDIENGSLLYLGDPDFGGRSERFEVSAGLWAAGTSREKKLDSVEYGFQYLTDPGTATNDDGGLLDLWGRTHADRSGVDYAVVGPPDMDVDVVLLDGWAQLYEVRGDLLVTANGVYGGGLSGDLDLYAAVDGMELDLRPLPGDTIQLQAMGDVVLALPRGTDVDLEVVADPDWGVTVTDLGFDELQVFPDYVHAVGGDGSIPITVTVGGGAFVLLEAAPELETE